MHGDYINKSFKEMSFALSQVFWEMEENLQHPEVAIELEKIFCNPLNRPSLPLI